jgi:hypothetical protein
MKTNENIGSWITSPVSNPKIKNYWLHHNKYGSPALSVWESPNDNLETTDGYYIEITHLKNKTFFLDQDPKLTQKKFIFNTVSEALSAAITWMENNQNF